MVISAPFRHEEYDSNEFTIYSMSNHYLTYVSLSVSFESPADVAIVELSTEKHPEDRDASSFKNS